MASGEAGPLGLILALLVTGWAVLGNLLNLLHA